MQILWLCWSPEIPLILLTCEWANCEQLHVNMETIRQIVKVLHTWNRPT